MPSVNRWIPEVLELIPSDSLAAGRLLAGYGVVVGLEKGDYEAAQEVFHRAQAIADREGDAGLERRILAESIRLDHFFLRYRECLERSLKLIELGHQADDDRWEALSNYRAAIALLAMGNLEGGYRHASEALAGEEKAEPE
jgi:tetratricopeptide (TPR) repeat protein